MDSMDVIEVLDVTVRVPGSCGELLQGWHHGEPFLVTERAVMFTVIFPKRRIFSCRSDP